MKQLKINKQTRIKKIMKMTVDMKTIKARNIRKPNYLNQ